MSTLILRLDISGMPVCWVRWQHAVSLYSRDVVVWTAGENVFTFHGGVSRQTGMQSKIQVSSIIAIRHLNRARSIRYASPPLTNRALFLRDANLCMYCGNEFSSTMLTRDHVIPLSRSGKDCWSNVVTACRHCNVRKGNRSPEDAKMVLLAIPYVPNWAEYLVLSNRRILADQMEFLKARFSDRPMPFSRSGALHRLG